MITGDTITIEQIRDLRTSSTLDIENEQRWWRTNQALWTESGEHNHDLRISELRRTITTCDLALVDPAIRHVQRPAARARCAEILNARARTP